MASVDVFIGIIIHCPEIFSIQVYNPGFIVVKDSKITAIGNFTNQESIKNFTKNERQVKLIELKKNQILIPGLIDTHIHAPQYPNVGLGYDEPLLKWLDKYTYKLEAEYKDLDFSSRVYNALVKKGLDHGTTTACYFASLYESSSLVLVDAAIKHGQRALVGKINMINLAPPNYIETREESIINTKKFIAAVKSRNNKLVSAVITPRFAPSVDADLMKELGKIAKEENLHIQSHISENEDELLLVQDLFNTSYAKVYDDANLLTNKTVMAHGIHLKDDEIQLLAQRGTSISHCPSSNTALKSGLCDVRRLISGGLKVGLGTDVAGGPSPSIIKEMREALDTSIHISYSKKDHKPLTYDEVFSLATLGGAQALALDDKVGNFKVGKDFDALLVDLDIQRGNVDYLQTCDPLELLQKFVYTSDDRNVRKVYVAGKLVKNLDCTSSC